MYYKKKCFHSWVLMKYQRNGVRILPYFEVIFGNVENYKKSLYKVIEKNNWWKHIKII